jgi:ASC-1-like (ASCH) protein
MHIIFDVSGEVVVDDEFNIVDIFTKREIKVNLCEAKSEKTFLGGIKKETIGNLFQQFDSFGKSVK